MKSTTHKKGIHPGPVEIPDEAFEHQNVKIKVTAYIDLDIVKALKDEAKKTNSKYQTLMNQRLRRSLFGTKMDHLVEIRNIVKEEVYSAVKNEVKKLKFG